MKYSKHNYSFLYPLLFCVLFAACRRDVQVEDAGPAKPEKARMTILGEERANPFTIENMRKALANVQARMGNSRTTGTEGTMNIVPTHEYYRFKPADVDQLMDLEQGGFDLWDFRLDADVEDLGDYYHDPTVPETEITWMYTCVPYGTPIPTHIYSEKLADLFLISDDSGDENDPEEWGPVPCDNCPDPTQPCNLPCDNGRMTGRKVVKKGSAQLRSMGIATSEVYNEAMRISGNEDEITGSGGDARQAAGTEGTARRFTPRGRITVTDTDLPGAPAVGVRNLLIKTRRWFKLDHTYTDANGNFNIGKGYRQKVVVVAKFKNAQVTLRSVNGGFRLNTFPWEAVFPIKKNLGKYSKTEMEGLQYHFPYNVSLSSNEATYYAAATALNAMAEFNQAIAQQGLPGITQQLTIWLSNRHASSSTLMARAIHGSLLPQNSDAWGMVGYKILQFITEPAKGIITRVLARNAPDIITHYSGIVDGDGIGTAPSAQLSNTMYHELAHAQHFSQVGAPYWNKVNNVYINNSNQYGDSYGQKGDGDRTGTVAVVESWGYYVGNILTWEKYRFTNQALAQQQLNRLENQVPGDGHWENWIPSGMLHDMTDVGEPAFTNVTDFVNGYTMQQLFLGFQPNILSVRGLQQEILSRNGNQQAVEVDQLVTTYRW